MAATKVDGERQTKTRARRPWIVVLFDDDFHPFDEVVLQVQKATGKSEEEAFRITLEAHRRGKAVAYQGPLDDCQKVAGVLRRIRLQVDVDEV